MSCLVLSRLVLSCLVLFKAWRLPAKREVETLYRHILCVSLLISDWLSDCSQSEAGHDFLGALRFLTSGFARSQKTRARGPRASHLGLTPQLSIEHRRGCCLKTLPPRLHRRRSTAGGKRSRHSPRRAAHRHTKRPDRRAPVHDGLTFARANTERTYRGGKIRRIWDVGERCMSLFAIAWLC